MPIYEYICTNCSSRIEVVQKTESNPLTRCGFRCPLPAHDSRDIRGFGVLNRCISTFSSQTGSKLNDKPTLDEIKKSGFSVYRNEGDGVITKISGEGPQIIETNKKD
jgi:hypothetical protein